MSGYDQFFKEAQKASGLSSGAPPKKNSQNSQPKFSLKADRDPARSQSTRLTERPKSVGGSRKVSGPETKKETKKETPEDLVRRELQNRSRTRTSALKRKKQAFPVFPAICAIFALVSCGVGYYKPDVLDGVLARIEIGAFGKAEASESAKPTVPAKSNGPPAGEKVAANKEVGTATPARVGTPTKVEDVPDVRNWSDEELSFFKKLNERKKELDLRESELVRLEEELQKQKAELDEKIKQLESMRTQISQTLKSRVATDQQKVDKLVEFYSTMKAPQASKIIESLNEDLAVEVLDKMKKKNVAEIMNTMDAKKARRLSELLTGYQRTPSSEKVSESEKEDAAKPEEPGTEADTKTE